MVSIDPAVVATNPKASNMSLNETPLSSVPEKGTTIANEQYMAKKGTTIMQSDFQEPSSSYSSASGTSSATVMTSTSTSTPTPTPTPTSHILSSSRPISQPQPPVKIVIKGIDMSDDMRDTCLAISKDAFQSFKLEKDIAYHIKKEFDKSFGNYWHCIVGRSFGSYVTHGK